ncbi:hypothetical protein [Hyella patelloides]|uniref:hypothetical protein n=1 Tax=Hyella patelloides TaxID=1982969 RepID=UPI0016438142|nr:hypothetical protein [Hyella patelloides]
MARENHKNNSQKQDRKENKYCYRLLFWIISYFLAKDCNRFVRATAKESLEKYQSS